MYCPFQFFIYIPTTKEMIIKLETCMAFINSTDTPWMTPCSGSKNEEWTYNEVTCITNGDNTGFFLTLINSVTDPELGLKEMQSPDSIHWFT